MALECIYWIDMNVGIEHTIKYFSIFTKFSVNQPKENFISNKLPWLVIGADIICLYESNYHCLVDYHSKFHDSQRTESLSADSLTLSRFHFCRIWITKINVRHGQHICFREIGRPFQISQHKASSLPSCYHNAA